MTSGGCWQASAPRSGWCPRSSAGCRRCRRSRGRTGCPPATCWSQTPAGTQTACTKEPQSSISSTHSTDEAEAAHSVLSDLAVCSAAYLLVIVRQPLEQRLLQPETCTVASHFTSPNSGRVADPASDGAARICWCLPLQGQRSCGEIISIAAAAGVSSTACNLVLQRWVTSPAAGQTLSHTTAADTPC